MFSISQFLFASPFFNVIKIIKMSVVCHRRIENIKKIKLKRVLFHRHGLIVFYGKVYVISV